VKYGTLFHALYLPLLFISLLVTLSGCGTPDGADNDEPGYEISFNEAGDRIITVKKGIGHFSMVCPDGFRLGIIKIDNSGGIESLLVDFVGPVTPDVGLPLISVSVVYYDESFPAYRAAESLLSSARGYKNFILLDESTVTVAGVTAYQHSFYFDTYPYDQHFPPPKEYFFVTRLIRSVFLDYGEFSLTLRLGSDPSREEQDMATLDKVLESFKVLD